jgi:SpoVK/Ycf46/Vps4 family AAA+-type ATPase
MNKLPDFILARNSAPKTHKRFHNEHEDYQPLLASWLLEMTLSLGWYKKANKRRGRIIGGEEFAMVAGVKFDVENGFDEDDPDIFVVDGKEKGKHSENEIRRILKTKLAYFQKQPIVDSSHLLGNIDMLGDIIGLNQSERAILCFVAGMHVFESFRDALSTVCHKTSINEMGGIIAHLFGQNQAEVLAGLSHESTLFSAGLIEIDSRRSEIEDRLSLLRGLGAVLTMQHTSVDSLMDKFLKRAGETGLTLENFPHLAQDATTLGQYLACAIQQREQGTNVLLYGIPGTGKTEFVKAISMSLGIELYEISFSDDEGAPIAGKERLMAYNLCQKMLSQKRNAMLMFDEIEDVFPTNGGLQELLGIEGSEGSEKSGKAWVNRILERNTTPTIWVTNDADIDPAYLRRFDYSVRFPVPPQKVRMEIARHHLGLFDPSESWLSRIAANEEMTPAQYERAAKVARLSSRNDNTLALRLVEQALDRSATLLGQNSVPTRNTLYTGYDLGFTNTSVPMASILDGLKKRRQGTFCFYGPAGTGKSELARYIADELGMPFMLRRASDILSKWVGGSEKNIAQMFADARQQEAVLVLDEADSFLADRRDAQRSWEVTQVNELLTQMEAFNGIFVCTTNLMDKLDQASLRRFAFKVKFDYLNPDQRWAMFLREYHRLGGNEPDVADWEPRVRDLNKLTPGDFSVAARQFAILNVPVTAAELHRQLQEECRVKGGAVGKIGFVG